MENIAEFFIGFFFFLFFFGSSDVRGYTINRLKTSAVVDTTFVDIYVDTKNIPTCRYNIQHIDKRTMENKMSIIMWEAAMSYATTFK